MGARTLFGVVVMIVQVAMLCPSGLFQVSYSPANPKSSPSLRAMRCFTLAPGEPCHSKNADAGIRQRWKRRAFLNDGLSATVSALALNILEPILGSRAQLGIRHQRIMVSSWSVMMAGTELVGL